MGKLCYKGVRKVQPTRMEYCKVILAIGTFQKRSLKVFEWFVKFQSLNHRNL